jgi:hypothetical protein
LIGRSCAAALVAASLVLSLSTGPVDAATAADAAFDYGSTGWSYQQVPYDGEPEFYAPGYDASSWLVGQAGFGTMEGRCPWNNGDRVHTVWESEISDMLLRRHFTVPAGATDVRVTGTVDNDADVYVNGTLLGHTASGSCLPDEMNVDVPSAGLGSDNVIAVRARNLGGPGFVDVKLSYVPAVASTTAVTVAPTTLDDARLFSAYSAQLAASGGTAPYRWSVTDGSLPTGLSLDADSGLLRGMPVGRMGAASFTVTATDADGRTGSRELSLSVTALGRPMLLLHAGLWPDAVVGMPYTTQATTTGGVPPLTWSAPEGLPAWLSLDPATGVLSGTPTEPAQRGPVTLAVRDANGTEASNTWPLGVVPPLFVTSSTLPTAVMGVPYHGAVVASGGVVPYTWSLQAGTLPAGLTLNPESGEITGTPTGPVGSSPVTVLATDANGHVVAAEAAIEVSAALAVTSSSLPAAAIGTAYSTTLTAVGGVAPYRWAVTAGTLPAGLRLDADSGAVTGTPTGPAGISPITLTVTDAAGATATLSTVFDVDPAAAAAGPQGLPPASWVQTVVVVVLRLNGSYPILPPGTAAGDGPAPAYNNHRYMLPA